MNDKSLIQKNRKFLHDSKKTSKKSMTTLQLILLIILLIILWLFSYNHVNVFKIDSLSHALLSMKDRYLSSSKPNKTLQIKRKRRVNTSNQLNMTLFLNRIDVLKEQVRILRASKVIMPWNATALALTNKLQFVTHCYLLAKYGPGPYIIEMTLQFPECMINASERLKNNLGIEKLTIELAPIDWLPHAVFTVSLQLTIR